MKATSTQDAQAIRLRMMAELRARKEQPGRQKVSDAAKAWLERKTSAKRRDGSARLAPTTVDRYTNSIEHVTVILGDYFVDALTPAIVRDWRDALAEEYASSTVNGHLRVLRTFLADHGQPAAERVSALEIDDTRITEDAPNLLTSDELRQFFTAARGSVHYALILLLVTTGARISTARALRWEDLDPMAGVIHLRRRLSKSEVLPGVKRRRTSKDVVPLLPELHRALEASRATFNDRQKASGLVFPSAKTGRPVSRSVLNKPIVALLAKAELSMRLTPHGFRRTAALAYRLAAGSTWAKDVLGHQTEEMARHYAPEQPHERQRAADIAFRGVLAEVSDRPVRATQSDSVSTIVKVPAAAS